MINDLPPDAVPGDRVHAINKRKLLNAKKPYHFNSDTKGLHAINKRKLLNAISSVTRGGIAWPLPLNFRHWTESSICLRVHDASRGSTRHKAGRIKLRVQVRNNSLSSKK